MACFSFYFSNIFSCLEILKNFRFLWLLEREDKLFNNMWENCQMNDLNFEKLVDLVRPGLEKHDT